MKPFLAQRNLIAVAMFAIFLTACGGGGGGGGGDGTTQMGGARQGVELSLAPTVSTFAGTDPAFDGTGAAARFKHPGAVVAVGGNLYVADRDNNKIRKIVIATGVVTTLAGTGAAGAADGAGSAATFNGLFGITTDGTNLFVADRWNHKIRQIVIATGVVSSVTGIADIASAQGAADGAGASATFDNPSGITSDGTNLYVADTVNNKIRQIVIATGMVSSLTGAANTTVTAGAADGPGASASFSGPYDVATDGTNLYVSDTFNNKIRKIVIANGTVSSLTGAANTAGTAGVADGAASSATFQYPNGIATDGTYLYVADSWNNKIRLIVISTGEVSSFTGTADTAGQAGFVDGAGASGTFNYPSGITTDGTRLYVADTNNNAIRVVSRATAEVTTLAGPGPQPGTDGTGAQAAFNGPQGVTTDGTNLYVADTWDQKIRKIVIATGEVSTLAGSGGQGEADGAGASATFNGPVGITTDGTNLYVADTYNHKIRKIVIASGEVSTLAGMGSYGATDGPGATAKFYYPTGITTDGTNLYVADMYNNKLRKVVIATGVVTSLTGAVDTAGTAGAVDGAGVTATFNQPFGITTDGTNLYVADYGNNKLRKVVIATAQVSGLTGLVNMAGAAGASDSTGTFNNPSGITTDGTNLYVVDSDNNKIRKVVIATGQVSSVTGAADTAGTVGAADGTGTSATFNRPFGITTDGKSLYVADMINNTIRKIR